MKRRLISLALVLSLLAVVAVGVGLGANVPTAVIKADEPTEYLWDPEIHVCISDHPNMFPNLWSMLDAEIGGQTYQGAVVNMNAGRLLIQTEATFAETGEVQALPAEQEFSCCLTTELYLLADYTYYGYYRMENAGFQRVPLQTDLAPITLVVDPNEADVGFTGTLGTGITVGTDTTATLYLRNCTNGSKPYYEMGQYQFYVIAVPD